MGKKKKQGRLSTFYKKQTKTKNKKVCEVSFYLFKD